MRSVKFGTLIDKSFQEMIRILFRPFQLKKWLFLIFIAMLAGVLGGGSGNIPGGNRGIDETRDDEINVSRQYDQTSLCLAGGQRSLDDVLPKKNIPIIIAVFLIAFIVYLILSIFVNSRFVFVWFRNILANDASVMEPYSRHAQEGVSYFKFSLAVFMISVCLLALLAWQVFLMLQAQGVFSSGYHLTFAGTLKLFIMPILCFLVLAILGIILGYILHVFIVPIMALEGLSVAAAFARLKEVFSVQKGDLCLFTLLYIALGILAGLIEFILVIIIMLVFLLAALVLFGIPYLAVDILLKAKAVFIGYAILMGLPFALAVIIVLIAANLPGAIFFRLFSFYYLSSIHPAYNPEFVNRYIAQRSHHIQRKFPLAMSVISMCLSGFVCFMIIVAAIALPSVIGAHNKPAAPQTRALEVPPETSPGI